MYKIFKYPMSYRILISALLLVNNALAIADVIDPEEFIIKNGYQSVQEGKNGAKFYRYTERTQDSSRVNSLEKDIDALPKHKDILAYCNSVS